MTADSSRWQRFVEAFWPPHWLRYVLVVPLIRAWRRQTRRSLSWRLAGSHFAAVLLSVVVICVVITALLAITSRTEIPRFGEASVEANEIAMMLGRVDRSRPLSDDDVSILLSAMQTGEIGPNLTKQNVSVVADVGSAFVGIRAISLVGSDGVIVASSDPELVSLPSSAIDETAPEIVAEASANAGNDNLDEQGSIRADGHGYLGSSAVVDSNGEMRGVIVVDKSERTLAAGFGILGLVSRFVLVIGLTLLVTVGVPAIPIGIISGFRRGRAIARPVTDLAIVADRFSRGELDARSEEKGEDEVAKLQRSFNSMATQLESSITKEAAERAQVEHLLAANRELIANVSHELRTPVAVIRGHLEALEAEPNEAAQYSRIALREVDRLEQLVNDLFQLARIESQRFELEIVPFDAGSAVREAVEALAGPARREAGVAVSAQLQPSGPWVDGDRSRLVQVLLNLIRNAIRHTPEGGIIVLGTVSAGANVEITVRDTGLGIDSDDLAHVFERFYRAEGSRNRTTGGAGLGLAIAKELIEAMGGTIAVESVLDEGTTFAIRLPRAAQPQVESGQAPVAASR